MSNTIKGGALEFDIIANNGQLERALEETKRRIQGFTDATVEGGERMEAAYTEAAAQIEAAFKDVDAMSDMHRSAIAKLEKEYAELGNTAAAAFMKGTAKGDEEYRAAMARQEAVRKEIDTRKGLMLEIEASADALQREEQRLNSSKEAVEKNTKAQISLREEIRRRREEMAALVLEAQREGKVLDENSGRYAELRNEIGNLTDLQGDIAQQAKALGNDEGMFQGVISAISGVSGAFTAAQGAIGLFAGENENLQKVMLKVQSLMSITIGLQQVAQTLNKDSYFSLKILGGIKQWWAGVVAKATVAQAANTAATGAQAAAATAGTAANIGLAGAFRLVGVAIKSIPVFGWIIAGITALGTAVWSFTKESREAKKAAEEFRNEVVEIAKKPITAIQELSFAWAALGDDMEAKERFVKDNADRFKDLGVSVKNAADAEKILTENKDKFIEAQILKAKAMAATNLAAAEYEKALKKLGDAEAEPPKYAGTGDLSRQRFDEGSLVQQFGRSNADPEKLLKKGSIIISKEWEEWSRKNKELEDELNNAGAKFFKIAAEYTAQEQAILAKLGVSASNITAGSIAALENEISTLRQKYKEATTDTERANFLKQIEEQEKLLQKMTGENKIEPEPDQNYAEGTIGALEKAVSAKQALLKTLSDPEAYRSALKEIEDLQAKIDAITGETEKAVLDKFEKELKTQLTGAHSILEMLSVLEEQRKQLTGDGSELDNGKKNVLDTAQANVAKQAETETKALLDQYAGYLQKKVDFEVQYGEKRRLLNEQLAKAETDDKRRIVLEALANLEKERKKYSESSGNEDYDKLMEEYKTYEKKRADIAAEYDEKIRLARQHDGSGALVSELEKAKENALSESALDEIMNSDTFNELFGNLDNLTVSRMIELRNKLEGEWKKFKLSPKELEALRERIDKVNGEIREKNPFAALKDAIGNYKKAEDDAAKKKSLKEMFAASSEVLNQVKGSFDAVTGALKNMGLAGDEATQQVMGDISQMIGSAGQLAKGIATDNPLDIIQGSIGFITSAFDLFNSRDRRAERAIKKHAEAVKELEKAYTALSWAVDKALGETVYDNQRALIDNMRKQREHLLEMQRLEEGKKKTDRNKIDEYQQQYEELGRQIKDTIAEISQSITQTTAKDLANQLADAIADTFTDGFNSKQVNQAIDKVVKQVMQNAVKNALKLQFLERPLEEAIKQLQRDMGFDSEGKGSFDGLTETEQKRFKDKIASIGGNFADAMKMYQDLFEDLDAGGPTTTLAGAIKGASQESIDLLAGQTNAVRVNQVQSMEILRDQLLHLASIDAGIGIANRYLASMDSKMSSNNYDPLRAQGITN